MKFSEYVKSNSYKAMRVNRTQLNVEDKIVKIKKKTINLMVK